jgi:quinol monooxygenase YgiN
MREYIAAEETTVSKVALFIKHRALPGKREEVQHIWEKHLQPRIAANPAHEAYFYCYDDADPDMICVFQQYTNPAASQEFLKAPWYAEYVDEVSPLLAGEPEIRAATPVWVKGSDS